MSEQRQKKLSLKIVTMCLLLATTICVGTSVSGYFNYRNSTYKVYNNFAYQIANTAISYIDKDSIDGYLESGKTDEAYDEMAKQLYNLYINNNLTSIYICQPDATAMTLKNIYDTRVHDAKNPESYALGIADPIGNKHPKIVLDVYSTGKLTTDYLIRKTSFGYNTSAAVPIINSNGKSVALLVVDVPMLHIGKTLNQFLLYTIVITILIVSAFMLFFAAMLKKQIINPLKLIGEEAARFIKSEHVVSKKLNTVHTGDEIEELAYSILKMENSIESYIDNLTHVTAEKERIGAELGIATQIQASMLPSIFPAFPGRKEVDIYATMHPAKEVGGDFYDFFLIDDDHLAIVIADVSGKGVPAALFMVIAKTIIKNHAQNKLSAAEVFNNANRQLCENNDAGLFVTAWMGILNLRTGLFRYVNAGHNPPALMHSDQQFMFLPSKPGFVLAGFDTMKYEQCEMQLQPGDTLYLYTDGVTEATNLHDELYGDDRMMAAINKHRKLSLAEMLPAIRQDIDLFVGEAPQFDDITMLVLKYLGK